jgi:N-acetylneuraminic acid mutarotase
LPKHPGFPRTALVYHADTDEWTTLGSIPISRATVPTVLWNNHIIVPNGEVRPRVRTPEVWSLSLP